MVSHVDRCSGLRFAVGRGQRVANALVSPRLGDPSYSASSNGRIRGPGELQQTEKRTELLMDGMNGMMGAFMALVMGFWAVLLLVLLVVLALAAVWLFQQIRRGASAPNGTGGYPPENRP